MASEEKSSMPGLVVVGSYNTDLIIWCDRIPSRGETLMGGNSEMFCGGRGATARWLLPEPVARLCSSAHTRQSRSPRCAGCELGKQPISGKLGTKSRSGNS
jgi:hypothetical protein